MQREAEAHAEEDKKAKEAIEIKNNADNLAYQCEKQLKELGDKISGDKKKQVEDAIAAVREAIEKNDTEAMKRAYDDLQNKFQEVSAELYKQASAGAGPQAGKVVALGTGKIDDNGKKVDFTVKSGDKVLISKYGGTEIKIDGDTYLIMREDDILGIIG